MATLTVGARGYGICRACRATGPVILAETGEGRWMLSLSLCLDCVDKLTEAAEKLRAARLARDTVEFSKAMGRLHKSVREGGDDGANE